jgi:excisionase family DNA binding protein
MDDLVAMHEVARLAGVGPTAVKRWTDDGLLRCVRTAGGHRRFRRDDVDAFLRARGGAVAAPAEPWVGALLAPGDPRALEAFLLAERARTGAWHRVATRAGEALEALGELWRSGVVTVVEEHLASERLARALARVGEAIPLASDAPRALLACAEEDEHTLGLALVEIVLREAGWATSWVGRRTPIAELRPALASGVRMLAVSASQASSNALDLRRQAVALGRLCRTAGVALVLGGNGAWPDRPRTGIRFRALEPCHRWAVAERERFADDGRRTAPPGGEGRRTT